MKKLYYGGHVITMEDEREVEAVLVENGEIIDVGEMQKFQHLLDEPNVEKQDLDGKDAIAWIYRCTWSFINDGTNDSIC